MRATRSQVSFAGLNLGVVSKMINSIYKKERQYVANYDKDNFLNKHSAIFELSKFHRLKSVTGVDSQPMVLSPALDDNWFHIQTSQESIANTKTQAGDSANKTSTKLKHVCHLSEEFGGLKQVLSTENGISSGGDPNQASNTL